MRPLTILEERILDLAKREPGANPGRVNIGADMTLWTATDETRFVDAAERAQLVYQLRAKGLLRPHDPKKPGLYLT